MPAAGARLTSILKQLPLWWHNQVAAMRALDELQRCPGAEVLRTAHDFGMTVQGLKSVAARGPVGGELMERMALSYGLDAAALRRANLNLQREIAVQCTFCDRRFRCARDLADADGLPRAQAYCPNAPTFASLAGTPGGSAPPTAEADAATYVGGRRPQAVNTGLE
jgi:hypothetical protein